MEIGLRMIADRAGLRRGLADDDMAAVGTLPDLVALPGEDQAVFDIFQQLAIAGLVGFFDLGDAFKQGCDLVKALGTGVGGEGGVHIRPFVVFALGGVEQVFLCRGDLAAAQELEPQLGVLLFVGCRFFKQRGDLLVAVLPGFGGVIGVFVAGLGFAGKGGLQVPFVTSAKIGDCTKLDTLRTLGIKNFDLCFVCIGENFQSSLE